ncbi:carbohydrate kinase family protein [Nonomuraea sp. KC401]|uniref:carbohydrate kinase family protein n=1 Tax=unclassified Nonomuraea TaxID=2593643 RepID=UPI0010FDFB95|nr:PfkB family carbohydrate kinase [Nonomuraea sp. KC401]NBE94709.1 carbohydrate kinase family protein [Nonomuraea sp. K271]TLF75643.1 carbohydrate kinase family protein [Nonomuraea sp. KC401]
MNRDLLVLGGAGVDTTVYVPGLPLPYRDTYLVPPVVDRIGNTGAGVTLGCHALGLAVAFADLIGDDPQGALVRRALDAVECRWGRAEAGTRRSVLLVGPDGRRTSLHDAKVTPGERLARELYADIRPRHVHVSIMDFCRHALGDFGDVPISTDLHDWDGASDYHKDFAYRADLVFLSETALPDPAAAMRDLIARGRARTVVCTRGARGCLVLTRGSGVRAFPAAPPSGPVADSNGAGDAFVSGFLYGTVNGRPLEECVRLGAIAGAHACTVTGTHESPITETLLLARSAAK